MKKLFSLFFLSLTAVCFIGIMTASAATWYVDPGGGGTGSSPADPTDIHTAVASSSAGDSIFMLSAHYTFASTVTVTHDLVIAGTGISTTIVDCSTAEVCFSFDGTSVTNSSSLKDMRIENAPFASPVNGAVAIDNGASPVIDTVKFKSNHTGINSNDGAPRIVNSFFYDNSTGIRSTADGTPVSVSWNEFKSNINGFDADDPHSGERVNYNTFTDNTVGMYLSTIEHDTNMIISNNTFDSNSVGGLYMTSTSTNSTGSTISNTSTVRDNSFIDNYTGLTIMGSPNPGGSYDPALQEAIVNANYFDANTYMGLRLEEDNSTVQNNLFEDHDSTGIYVYDSVSTIRYNTIANSSFAGIWVGASTTTSDTSIILNNIVATTTIGVIGNYGVYIPTSTTTSVGYNDSFMHTNNYYGSYVNLGGNISVNPIFVGSGSYELQSTSPLISYARLQAITYDYNGDTRDPLGGIHTPKPEIGAFEYN